MNERANEDLRQRAKASLKITQTRLRESTNQTEQLELAMVERVLNDTVQLTEELAKVYKIAEFFFDGQY